MNQLTHQSFRNALEHINPAYQNSTFLLAVSGGVDSMVLLHLFQSLNLKFQVAHINYHLRGEDSNLDQQLVSDYCIENHIKFHLYEVLEQEKPKNSIQTWARELRYQFFDEIIKSENIDNLATAHHLNDELETFIINLSRGSGLKGLSGIPKNENQILRPLLCFEKEEIYRFAKAENIQFREDISNKKNDYLRNKIRNQIVPLLLETNENFLDNFQKSIGLLSESQKILTNQIDDLKSTLFKKIGNDIHIQKDDFFALSSFLQFELLKNFGFQNEFEISKIKSVQSGSVFKSREFEILIEREILILKNKFEQKPSNLESKIICEKFSEKAIEIKIDKEFKIKNLEWIFDADKLIFPLKIRIRKEGDYFYPIGMLGKKKVSKYFKDEKILNSKKSEIKILVDGNDEILGVIPFRQDRRCSFENKKSKMFKIKFK